MKVMIFYLRIWMKTNTKELKRLVSFMKTNNLLWLRLGDIEMKLSNKIVPRRTKKAFVKQEEIKSDYTPEDILLWSTPGVDDTNEDNTAQG